MVCVKCIGEKRMKFKNKKERRMVTETMGSLLNSLKIHVNDQTRAAIDITLFIIDETEVESWESTDD